MAGPGRLVGLDNGDSTDYDPYKGTSRRLFAGKLMAIIAATTEAGPIYVRAQAPGLTAAELALRAHPAAPSCLQGISAIQSNRPLPIRLGQKEERPLRKVELRVSPGQHLDADLRTATVRAVLHPADTTWPDLRWSVVDGAGIPSNLAVVSAQEDTAQVTAHGDGMFYLRCTARNGGAKVRLISHIEFTVTGLGRAYKDPYEFVSAGLYTRSRGEVSNGNERGVATARGAETQVGIEGIDFGPYGSDLVTVPIFALTGEPYPIEIWQGMPGEAGAELLASQVYQKPTRWNVYQEEVFHLSRRMRGIASLTFVAHDKVHIKGFVFARPRRAFALNRAADADHLYGDSYTVAEGRVEDIGNNVSLAFEEMDFGPDGAAAIAIRGHSPIDRNSIHIHFQTEGGDPSQTVEFLASDGYEERVFALERVRGRATVTFVFLPGSHFHFESFRFLPA